MFVLFLSSIFRLIFNSCFPLMLGWHDRILNWLTIEMLPMQINVRHLDVKDYYLHGTNSKDFSSKLWIKICGWYADLFIPQLTSTPRHSIRCYSAQAPSSKLIHSSQNLLVHSLAQLHVTLLKDLQVSSFIHPKTYFYTLSLHYTSLCSRTF